MQFKNEATKIEISNLQLIIGIKNSEKAIKET